MPWWELNTANCWGERDLGGGVSSLSKPRPLKDTVRPPEDFPLLQSYPFPTQTKDISWFSIDRRIHTLLLYHIKYL